MKILHHNRLRLIGLTTMLLTLFVADFSVLAQTPIPIGPQIATFNSTRVRGYHFTATSNWTLCGLYIPTDNSTGAMNVEFVRFTQGPPPPFAGTTNNFVSLFYASQVAGTNIITVPNVAVTNNNIYGTYGARSQVGNPNQMMNSYGATATVTNVNGINMTLLRSGMQFPLNNQQMHDIWSEVNFNIGRIIMYHDCCPDPPAPVFDQAPQQLCVSDTFTYSVDPTVWGAWQIQNVAWTLPPSANVVASNNDSSEIQIVFSPGAFQVNICAALVDTCGAGPQTCIPVTINPLFADAGPDQTVCTTSVELAANAGLGTWSVVQGSGTFSNLNDPAATVSGMTPGAVNTFRWTMSNQNCPPVMDEVSIIVNPIPVTQYTAPDGCEGAPILFESQSFALGGNIVDWDWDVDGDGAIDYTLPTFNHAYGTPGTKQCTLIVTANLGCQDTLIQTIEVFPNPVASFAYAADCEGTPMAFTDGSSIASGFVVDWFWDFGDGGTASAENPLHIYNNDSVYLVSLTAISDEGCTSTISDSVVVYTVPTVDFTAPPECWNVEVEFTDYSTSVQGDIVFWEWDFGDGSTTVQIQDTVYQYGAAAGTYNVRLTVATDSGCTNSVVKPVNIYPVPIPAFTTEGVCQDARIVFHDASILDTAFNSYLTEWNYEFGDGLSENTEVPGHFYSEPGYFTVDYTPVTNHGCEMTAIQDVLIRPRPQANLVILDDRVCAQTRINFKDETYFDYTYDSAGVVNWHWEFGDDFTSTQQDPFHKYQEGGEYEVVMAVETSFGCADSAQRMAIVYHNPVARFSADSNEGCSPYCVVFRNESVVKTAEDLVNEWTFGDGKTSGNVNPTHCFTAEDGGDSRTFPIALKVTTPDGCVDSTGTRERITVHANPIADFTINDQTLDYLDPVVYIENMSIGGQFFDWDFGDSTTTIMMDPFEHEYAEPGYYVITLDVASQFGCLDQVSEELIIERHQTLFVPTSFSPNGDGLNDWFFIEGEDLEEMELWIYDRWGNELFYGKNEGARWNGKVGSKMSPIGVYGFVLKYKHKNMIRQTEQGTFTISKTNAKRE